MKTINLGIIEDIPDIRENLLEYFSNEPGFNCVVCEDSVEAFMDNEQYEELPDIVLSDIGLPGMSGTDGIPLVKGKFPDADVVLLTVFKENDIVFKALCAGASGYVLKGTSLNEIRDAIICVADGGSYMSPAIARKVISFFAPMKLNNETLTSKESEIVQALADGLSYKLIADRCSIKMDTLRFHIKNIYKKLHVNSKAEVIRKVYRGEV
jgi:DNA-binding NarL/FixJ family response regulator